MRKIDERALTRNFLKKVTEDVGSCKSGDVVNSIDPIEQAEDHGELQADEHGIVSPEELYRHFDLDGDGVVTKKEYADHVNWHCAHPEVLDACQDKRYECMHDVPCMDSYDATMEHALADVDNFMDILSPLMQQTGATCMDSTLQSLCHVLSSLKDCGMIK